MLPRLVERVLARFGFRLSRLPGFKGRPQGYRSDFTAQDIELVHAVAPFTMTSPERIIALRDAVEYVVANRLPGAIVECGVWKGGSMLVVAKTLARLGDRSRELVLFDTFEGMPEPTPEDVSIHGVVAAQAMADPKREEEIRCRANMEEVRRLMDSSGYPPERIRLVRGRVEQTLPAAAPEAIALLRLDTDWYESTRHELEHLFPRLARGGVLILDDYGHWKGARKAVDEFLHGRVYFARIDYTGRVGVKV